MSRYASNTSVSVERSKAEIERTLARYGATSFAYGWDQAKALIQFVQNGKQIRFTLPLPDRNDRAFTHTPSQGYKRTADKAEEAWEQSCRQSWRALALIIKAKLEAVEAGIVTFEDEFLAHTMLPNGQTFAEWAEPQIDNIYAAGAMPALLSGG